MSTKIHKEASMLIWLVVVVPMVATIFLFLRYKDDVAWWEYVGLFGLTFILIGATKCTIESTQTRNVEYWGGWVVTAIHEETWNERAYDIDYHPEVWYVVTSNNEVLFISSAQFASLAARFGNKTFVDMHRVYYSDDGDKYVTTWNGNDAAFEPAFTQHTYTNRVQVPSSVYTFPEVTLAEKTLYGLFNYPEIQGYRLPSLLGGDGPAAVEADRRLTILNAKLGKEKQVRVIVLVFKGQPVQAGYTQQAYWKNGNKNEFVVMIGTDAQHRVTWCLPMSWTEVESLKAGARYAVMAQKGNVLNLNAVVSWLEQEIPRQWVRKKFADFSYLTVEPPGWVVLLVFFIVIVANVGWAIWSVRNDFAVDHADPFSVRRRRW